MKKTLSAILLTYFLFSFFPAWALMAYSPNDNIIVASQNESNMIWYKSLNDNDDHAWKKGNGITGKAGFNKIIYDGKKFIAIANYATIWFSVDGKNWEIAQGLTGNTVFRDIIHTKWGYLVVGSSYKHGIWSSTDGKTWQDRVKKFVPLDLSALTDNGNNTLVAVGNYQAVYSNDGGLHLQTTNMSGKYNDVAYGRDKFVAVGDQISYSYDGKEWVNVPYKGKNLRQVKYAEKINKFIALGDDSNIWYSSDAISWTKAVIDNSTAKLTFLDVSSPYYFVAGGEGDNSLFYSSGQADKWYAAKNLANKCLGQDCFQDKGFKNFDSLIHLKDGNSLVLTSPLENFNSYLSSNGSEWMMSGSLSFNGRITLPHTAGYRPVDIAVSPNGQSVYVINYAKCEGSYLVYIYWYAINPKDGSLIFKGSMPLNEKPSGMAFSHDGQYLYLSVYKSIYAYKIESDGALSLLGSLTSDLLDASVGITVSPDGNYLYALEGNGWGSIAWFKINNNISLTYQGRLEKINNLWAFAINHDGRTAYGSDDWGINSFDIHADGSLQLLKGYKRYWTDFNVGRLYDIAISPNNPRLYVLEWRFSHFLREIKINISNEVKLEIGPIMRAPQEEDGEPISLTISPNGKYIYTASNTGRVQWFSIVE